jgi:signal transduction histidine kinase
MKIFRKTFITVFSCFLIIILILSYILAINHIDDSENALIEQNRIHARLISKQIEIGYLQSDWPYELLSELANRDDFMFWWVVKGDGAIYRSDDVSFMKTSAYEYFPQLKDQIELDDTIYRNNDNNYGIYFKSFNYGNEVWTIWIGFSLDGVYFTSMNIITTVAFIVISTLIAISVIIYLLVKSFTNPIVKLWKTVSEVGKGNFDVRSDIKSKDEIGQLSTEFNTMTINMKESQSKIEQYSKNLEKLLRQKDEFINQLGHDLKTPLGPLIALLPIVRKNTTDPKIKEMVNVSIKASIRVNNLVKKTLKLAQLNSTNHQSNFKKEKLATLIEDAIEKNNYLLKKSNIIIKNNSPKGLFVEIDALLISELFDNLITNAIKYSPNGGTVSIESIKKEDNIIVSIKDEGIGLDEEQIKYIFDEFYKTDSSRHDLDSSGLGLTICKRIIERHDGEIWADSEGLGKGSTFYFKIPLKSHKNNKKIITNSYKAIDSKIDKLLDSF